jgi:GNAT superfamily N-acetyltransferase/predicted kinase
MSVTISQLPIAALKALATGDVAAARQATDVPLSDWIGTDDDCVSTWRRRAVQVAEDPDEQPWVTGVVLADGEPVGQAGFHEKPSSAGAVEVGYKIDPAFRGRGLAKATLAFLLDRAREADGVATVRASVGPWNSVSLHLVRSRGFVVVGEEMDEEDGLELVHELDVAARPTGSAETRLVILRGNSGSGKTSVAKALQRGRDRGTIAWVGQDHLRRELLHLGDGAGEPTVDLIDQTVRFALDRGRDVVLEGILGWKAYGAMLRCLRRDHVGSTRCFVWDLPFEETVWRHATKARSDFGEDEMARWFDPDPSMPGLDETVLGPEISLDAAVDLVRRESGL